MQSSSFIGPNLSRKPFSVITELLPKEFLEDLRSHVWYPYVLHERPWERNVADGVSPAEVVVQDRARPEDHCVGRETAGMGAGADNDLDVRLVVVHEEKGHVGRRRLHSEKQWCAGNISLRAPGPIPADSPSIAVSAAATPLRHDVTPSTPREASLKLKDHVNCIIRISSYTIRQKFTT